MTNKELKKLAEKNGIILTLAQAGHRKRLGWSNEKIVTTPIKTWKSKGDWKTWNK